MSTQSWWPFNLKSTSLCLTNLPRFSENHTVCGYLPTDKPNFFFHLAVFLIKNLKSFFWGGTRDIDWRIQNCTSINFYRRYHRGKKNWLDLMLQADTANCWHTDITLLCSTRNRGVQIILITDCTSILPAYLKCWYNIYIGSRLN
jgi:hypothetical protein